MNFTIDPDKALQKLGRLQLPGPDHYLLKLVQGAVQSGAERLRIDVGWRYLVMEFVPLGEVEPNLYGLLGPACATRSLAVGINSCPYPLRWEQDRTAWMFAAGRSWQEKLSTPRQGVRILVQRWFGNEAEWLKERCRWCPVPIVFNGVKFRPPLWSLYNQEEHYVFGEENRLRVPIHSQCLKPPRVPKERLRDPLCCRMAWAVGAHSRLDLVQHGVWIQTLAWDQDAWAVLDIGEVPTDLSGFQVLEEDELVRAAKSVMDG